MASPPEGPPRPGCAGTTRPARSSSWSGAITFRSPTADCHTTSALSSRIEGALLLQSPETLEARFRLDVRVGHEVTVIDLTRRKSMSLKLLTDADTDAILVAGQADRRDRHRDAGQADRDRSGRPGTGLRPRFGSAEDPVNMLGVIADNLVSGERTVQWHEVGRLLEDGATLVDVRTGAEFAAGVISKAGIGEDGGDLVHHRTACRITPPSASNASGFKVVTPQSPASLPGGSRRRRTRSGEVLGLDQPVTAIIRWMPDR